MKANLINKTTILINNERYFAWPTFGHQGIKKLRGLWNPKHLQWLLDEEDLFCDVWRRAMPMDILRELRRYPDHHAELIELAQLNPIRFVQLSQRNPAMTVAIATYWAFKPPWQMPRRSRRDAHRLELLKMTPRSVLSELALPNKNEWVHLLQKIPAYHSGIHHIKSMLQHFENDKLRRYLRHLSSFTIEVSWLLQLSSFPVDIPLLELAAKEPQRDGFLLINLVSSIITTREISCRTPVWPYNGTIRNWESLLRTEWRNALRCRAQSLQFPDAPVPVETVPEGVEIAPLTTPRLVKEEADFMQNCSSQFIKSIQRGERYLYRTTKPERATLLLQYESGNWQVEEIGLRRNIGEVSARTENLIYKWIRQNKKMAQRPKRK